MKRANASRGSLRHIKEKLNVNNLNLPARSSIFFTLTNLLCKGAAFIFTPIFTRLLSPAEYGEFSLFSSYLSLSAVVVTMEISGGIIMRLFQKERERRFTSILSAWIISVIAALPAVLVLKIIKAVSGFGMSFPLAYVFLFVSLVSISLINLYVSKCKFLYKWIPPLITSLMQSVAAPIISIALIRVNYFHELDHVATKIGTVTTVLALTAIFIAALTIKSAHKEALALRATKAETFGFIKQSSLFLLKLAAPLLPYYFSIIAISQADKLFISNMLGKSELAKYSVAYSAGVALTAVTGGIMGALSPWIMRKVRAGEWNRIKNALGSIISAAIPIIVIFLCFAPEIFNLLAPKEYESALPVLFISTLIPIPLALAQCMSSVAIAKERVGGVLLSGLIPAIITVALDALLIKRTALFVPALITASGYIILAALGVLNTRKITGNYVINVNKTFQKLLFLITIAAALFAFRSSLGMRIAIALISAASLLFMAKDVVALLKEKEL